MKADVEVPKFEFVGRELETEEMDIYLSILLNKDKEVNFERDGTLMQQCHFPCQILLKRKVAYKLPIQIGNFFMLMSLLTFINSPAHVVLLLWLCLQYYKKTGKTFLGAEEWGEIFPNGPPSNEELNMMWASQKHKTDADGSFSDINLLDVHALWMQPN